jgi:hypothetical protein
MQLNIHNRWTQMQRTFKAEKMTHQTVTDFTLAGTAISASCYLRSSAFICG